MIPTMIVFGLVVGFRWRTALVAAAVVWPALLVLSGVVTPSWQAPATLLAASALGAANAAVGVGIVQGALLLTRRMLRVRRSSDQ